MAVGVIPFSYGRKLLPFSELFLGPSSNPVECFSSMAISDLFSLFVVWLLGCAKIFNDLSAGHRQPIFSHAYHLKSPVFYQKNKSSNKSESLDPA